MPTWLLSVVFAFAFIGLASTFYFANQYFKTRGQAASAAPMALENPSAKGGAAKNHPLQKFIEVSGVRLHQDPKKNIEARFLVTNHSEADITDLGATVTIWGRTNRSEEESVGNFVFKLPRLGPNESKELSAPLNTKLKVYELPDWQNVTADAQVTSP